MTQSTQNFNFERCEDEPIHIPESVQSYGFLIAFNYEDLEVSIVSENCNTIFADEIIGKGFLDILSSSTDGINRDAGNSVSGVSLTQFVLYSSLACFGISDAGKYKS